jgi:acetylornithine deacetylase/succinyl-diaminopimelate desuccinylase-like protein
MGRARPSTADVTGEVTELLQTLIRNRCVNDGSAESGQEERNADALAAYLDGAGIDMERFAELPGRSSLVARIEGSDPKAPSLMLMGHTDVVPVNEERWKHDPFGAEIIDGFIWGRGAIDMLNLTSSMAVAFRRLVAEGFRPRGTLIYLGVADEESLGVHGAKWLTEQRREAVAVDYVLTEYGGVPITAPSGMKLPVAVGEKGTYWSRMRVRGTAGHGSMPFRTDNALVKAAEVIRRLSSYRPETVIHETWRGFVEGVELAPELTEALLDPDRLVKACEGFSDVGLARAAYSNTHTTFSPNVARGGSKTNVIPDTVELEVDIRTLPGQSGRDAEEMLAEALGDLGPEVEIDPISDDGPTLSPASGPLWDCLARVSQKLAGGAKTIPMMIVGGTDARFFRRLGATAYGYGLHSGRISYGEWTSMFHGDNERVDQESLRLSTALWEAVAKDFLE